ncbi:hypothetical protein Bequi_02140 [Brachybacterium sp. JHP9]|uniref:DNA modification methylase n=1 Tax=Brachybacterium equifaecis TaxID=2910770 RepID=A0ABT0QX48_9MICO|nr:hypothetical protein [Brachybacterium equifaecis]
MKTARLPRLALTAAALGLALTATGCTYFNPVQTHDFYQAADGTNGSVTGADAASTFEVGVRNAIVVVDESGTGELVASVVNYSDETQSVTLTGNLAQAGAEGRGVVTGEEVFTTTVTVAPKGVVKIGPASLVGSGESGAEAPTAVSTEDFPADPGTMMLLTMDAAGESTTITLPITSTSLPYYQGDEASDGGQG